jgi:polysaccharide export outer membrane protein
MIKLTFQKLFLFCLTIIVFASCNDVKNLTYFQKSRGHLQDTLSVTKFYVPRIHTGDLLSISINSLAPDGSSFFNPYSNTGAGASIGGASGGTNGSSGISQAAAPGYLVDAAGEIELPIIGTIDVNGYTTSQLRDTLKHVLIRKQYLKEPTVIVRFLNFKVTMLGEVGHPEVYNIPNEMITLPEAISMAGDLTQFAQRDSIQITRDVGGKKVVGWVNLNTREVFSSPYYYLHANDLIYVRPSKFKAQHNDRVLTLFTFGTSIISLLFIFLRK